MLPFRVSTLAVAGLKRALLRPAAESTETTKCETEYLRHYHHDARLGRAASALIAVKNLTQGRKNRERLDRLRRGVSRIGSPTARPPEDGLVGICRLSVDALSNSTMPDAIRVTDPIGIDVFEAKLAISSRNRVFVFDTETKRLQTFENPWFAALHSVAFSANGRRLLIASSGYDTIFELSVESGEVLWDWNSWEHGYSVSVAGGEIFTRNGRPSRVGVTGDLKPVRVDPSILGDAGVPIWQRAVHLNGAAYDHDGSILATLFHTGAAAKIDRHSKTCVELVSGLDKPHAFLRDETGGYVVTSTGGADARTLFLDESFRVTRCVSPSGLSGIRDGFPESEEWLQYATCLGDDLYCMVDIHRSSLFLVSPGKRTYRRVGFPRDWAVQMVISAFDGVQLPPQRLLPTRREDR